MSPRPRTVSRAYAAQTRAYGERAGELAAQLRRELEVPAPHGAPAVVLMMGLPGVGKTHVALRLAERLGAARVASDELRSRLFIAASYAPEENAAVFRTLDLLVDGLLGEGQRVIVDATHLTAASRAAATATAARRAVPLVHVRVVADESATLARLAARAVARAPHDRSDADRRVYERMRAVPFEEPAAAGHVVRNGPELERDLDAVVRAVEAACSAAR